MDYPGLNSPPDTLSPTMFSIVSRPISRIRNANSGPPPDNRNFQTTAPIRTIKQGPRRANHAQGQASPILQRSNLYDSRRRQCWTDPAILQLQQETGSIPFF
jgi:hypothetical protein